MFYPFRTVSFGKLKLKLKLELKLYLPAISLGLSVRNCSNALRFVGTKTDFSELERVLERAWNR